MPRIRWQRTAHAPEVAERPAQAVAPIEEQVGLDTCRGELPVDDGVVGAFYLVTLELRCEIALGTHRARERHDATRIPIEPMHHREGYIAASLAAQQRAHVLDKRLVVARHVRHAQ